MDVVIEARGVGKTFRVPDQRIDSLKERATHPFTRVSYRDLRALDDVSFDVRGGEFFGIVGRNGSGKSTLLKILSSIYRADAGSVRVAGRVAPFIELGVGFNPELAARANVVLNGVLMGLTRREAERRVDAVLDFAELREFADLKIKNYSSGMMVRLAFAVMIQADADIMLVDEVLAVGDAAFGQKCMEVFRERRRLGRTVVLVTHDMSTVQSLCHRAMLIDGGRVRFVGDPEDAAMRYFRMNFARTEGGDTLVPDFNASLVDARLRNGSGGEPPTVDAGAPLELDVRLAARRDFERAELRFEVRRDDHVVVTSFTRSLDQPVRAGEEIAVAARIENRLLPGRYHLDCWLSRAGSGGDWAVQGLRLLDFAVAGAEAGGVVSLDAEVQLRVEPRT